MPEWKGGSMSIGYYVKKAARLATDADERFRIMCTHGWYKNVPDDVFLKRLYKIYLGKELNLANPKTFCEKLNWLKLYDRRPEYTMMVDKYAAKKWVAEKMGEEHVIPMYGVWERFDDIDFGSLPDRFVLKCTHDSGGTVVCTDKASFDKEAAKKSITKRLKKNIYWSGREWPYKNVPPRIIAEQYVEGLGTADSVEYKLTCFDGVVRLFTVCKGIPHSTLDVRTNDHYDRDGKPLDFYAYYKNADPPVPFPEKASEIIAFSEALSAGIPQVRVDSYLIDGKVVFGEMTFYTWSGIIEFTPPEWDEIMGGWITLPGVVKHE